MTLWTGLEHIRMVVVNALRQENTSDLTSSKYFDTLPLQVVTFVDETGKPVDFGVPEYEIILVAGQSNSTPVGVYKDDLLDYDDARILQYPYAGTYANQLIIAKEPIAQGEGVISSQAFNSFATHFCKNYLRKNPNKKLVIVPMGVGDTGFSNNRWTVAGDLYNNAIYQVNKTLNDLKGSKLIAILWHQGERDISNNIPTANQKLSLLTLIDGFRANIINGQNVPFILGGISPDWQPNNLKDEYNTMYSTLHNERDYIGYADPLGLKGNSGDAVHYSPEALRTLGQRYFNIWEAAKTWQPTLPPKPVIISTTVLSGSSVKVVWNTSIVGIDYLNIQYRIVGTNIWVNSPNISPVNSENNLTGLTLNTSYELRIQTTNAKGNSYSNIHVITTTTTTNEGIVSYPDPKVWLKFNPGNLVKNDYAYGNASATNMDDNFIYSDGLRSFGGFGTTSFLVFNVQVSTEYTRAVWINVLAVRYGTAIFGTENGDAAGINNLILEGRAIQLFKGNNILIGAVSPIALSTWVHVVCTYTSAGSKHVLYINGKIAREITGNAHIPNNTNNKIFIGAKNTSEGYWNNAMDDVMIFDYAMTEAQVAKLWTDTK